MERHNEKVAMVNSGLEYCTAHHGVIECDGGDRPCDFVDSYLPEHKCPGCEGSGLVPTEEYGEVECEACDGEGTTRCTPTPLLYAAPTNGRTEGGR